MPVAVLVNRALGRAEPGGWEIAGISSSSCTGGDGSLGCSVEAVSVIRIVMVSGREKREGTAVLREHGVFLDVERHLTVTK
jgi:hypothetical protein